MIFLKTKVVLLLLAFISQTIDAQGHLIDTNRIVYIINKLCEDYQLEKNDEFYDYLNTIVQQDEWIAEQKYYLLFTLGLTTIGITMLLPAGKIHKLLKKHKYHKAKIKQFIK